MTDGPDPYKILQVDPEAEDEVIQAAYRRLAQKYHPDLATGEAAMARMVAINAAWETIGEPRRRALYDASRRAAARPPAAPRTASHPGRTDATGSGDAGSGEAHPDLGGSGARHHESPSKPAASTGAGASGPTPTRPESGTRPGAHARPAPGARSSPSPEPPRPPETVSRDWTPGRSTIGSGYDAKTMRSPDGLGAAGPPPGNPSGGIVTFGRYAGWSLGEIGRTDLEYLEWLDRMPIGRPYRPEIDAILRRSGRRRSTSADAMERRGLFRRS